jgi:hypothetical protein
VIPIVYFELKTGTCGVLVEGDVHLNCGVLVDGDVHLDDGGDNVVDEDGFAESTIHPGF